MAQNFGTLDLSILRSFAIADTVKVSKYKFKVDGFLYAYLVKSVNNPMFCALRSLQYLMFISRRVLCLPITRLLCGASY